MNNGIFLEFAKNLNETYFKGEGCSNKNTIENDYNIKGGFLCDDWDNIIGEYDEGIVDYEYKEGSSITWYGRWYASSDDLSSEEATAIIRRTDGDDCEYVRWAKMVLCLNEIK